MTTYKYASSNVGSSKGGVLLMSKESIKQLIDKISKSVNKELSKEVTKSYTFNIAKSQDEQQIAFGWAMISRTASGEEVVDLQGDTIEPDELEKLAYNYVKLHRDVGQLHETDGEGCVVESVVLTLDKQKAMGIPKGTVPIGWWVGLYIRDAEVWARVKDGTYKAFSIEGSATREEV